MPCTRAPPHFASRIHLRCLSKQAGAAFEGEKGKGGGGKWRGKGTYHLQVVFCTMNPPTRGPISGPINGLAVYTIIGAESSCYDSVNGKFFSAQR